VDSEADITSIPVHSCEVGSTVLVLETSQRYRLNHAKKWIKMTVQTNCSGEAEFPDEVIYDGGLI
jgi:hypothetical protein